MRRKRRRPPDAASLRLAQPPSLLFALPSFDVRASTPRATRTPRPVAAARASAGVGGRGGSGPRARPLLLLGHQIAAARLGRLALVIAAGGRGEAVLRREVERDGEVDARAGPESVPCHDGHLGSVRQDPRRVAGEVVRGDDHAILTDLGVLEAAIVELDQLRHLLRRCGGVVPDDRGAVLERVDRPVEVRERQGVVDAGGKRHVGVRSGRRRRRRVGGQGRTGDVAPADVRAVLIGGIERRRRGHVSAPRGVGSRPLHAAGAGSGSGGHLLPRGAGWWRRRSRRRPGRPTAMATVRARRFEASRRWSASRSSRACSFRSGFRRLPVLVRSPGDVVGQLRSSLMDRGSLPAFRVRTRCQPRLAGAQVAGLSCSRLPRGCTNGHSAEGGRARVRHQARPAGEPACGGGERGLRPVLQDLGARLQRSHRGRRRDHHLAHDGVHPVPEPADPRASPPSRTCSRSDCRSGPS